MNIFIDFDHTLYNTPLLTKDMLKALASTDNDVLEIFLNRVKTAFPDITEDQIKQLTHSVTKSKSISVDFMNELTETRLP